MAKGGESGFGGVEKIREELINKGVNAVGCGGFLANKVTSGAVDFAEFGVDRIGFLTVSGKLCPSGEKGFGDAQEVKRVGAGEEIFAVFFRFVGVDAKNEVAFVAEGGGEVSDVACFVFATEEDLIFWDFSSSCGGGNLLDEEGDSGSIVLDRKRGFKNVTIAVADESKVLLFCVIQCDAENFSGVGCLFKNGTNKSILITVDR